LRILHVIPWLHARYGGPVTALLGLATAQAEVGLDVRILATDPENAGERLKPELAARGISLQAIHPVTGPLLRSPQIPKVVSAACSEADIIHIHALYEEIQHQAALHARQFHKLYLIRPCGMLDPWSLAQSKWKKKLYFAWRLRKDLERASAMHFTTATERDLARKLQLGAKELVVPNGIRVEDFALTGENLFLKKHPQLASKTLVVYLGRLLPTKGLDLLISAFKEANVQNSALVIAGPGEPAYIEELQKLAGAEAVFTGLIEGREKIGLLHAAALFVLPSHHENFGNAVFEALACGTPVLISDQVQVEKEIAAAGVGAVFPLEKVALVNSLREWIECPERRKQAQSRIDPFLHDYSWKQIAARWRDHYDQLLSG
jgi:glycosyltransferase involved in cell wall biosynthesis